MAEDETMMKDGWSSKWEEEGKLSEMRPVPARGDEDQGLRLEVGRLERPVTVRATGSPAQDCLGRGLFRR